ncbi:integrase core domain-containing protein [Leuconostoc gelidum subsp. gelidum]|uniref:integrase core domain-containing protein n=1 Tax=Leuconostoc gelidum TaxID=1244 RepID=UPI001CC63B97|nr:integrase core domain-containing protein [Leuconostoc gelidum subsp. gelidum]
MKPLDSLIHLIPNQPYSSFCTQIKVHQVWQKRLKNAHITPSMSRRTTCLDNACIKSFFNKLKVKLGNLSNYNSAEKLITTVKKWIIYYNTKQIQMKLGDTESIFYRRCAA